MINGIPELSSLVDSVKTIVHHFNEKHKPSAILKVHLKAHLGTELVFIIPADTRFGLYLLMIHRVYLMRPALQSCVKSAEHIDFCVNGEIDDDEVVGLVNNDLFWDDVLNLLTLLLPVLRLIRLAELNGENIGKFYPLSQKVKIHLEANLDTVPYAQRIYDIFQERISTATEDSGEWFNDIHLAAYCLDPEFWDHPHYTMNDCMRALRSVVPKLFHFKPADPNRNWVGVIMQEFQDYKNKSGELSMSYVQEAAKNMTPTQFYESYGSSIPNLSFMAKKIFGICLANECSELDWHHFKLNRTKGRSRLSAEKIHKLITVQSAQIAKEKLYHSYKEEAAKWTLADEVCELSKRLMDSAAIVAVNFNNFIEIWENESMYTKNKAHEDKLSQKYL